MGRDIIYQPGRSHSDTNAVVLGYWVLHAPHLNALNDAKAARTTQNATGYPVQDAAPRESPAPNEPPAAGNAQAAARSTAASRA